MSNAHALTRTLALSAVMSMVSLATARAQVAPAPAPTAAPATPTFRAGWVAQVVSYRANVIGEVPLARFIQEAAPDDVFTHLAKLGITGAEAGLVLSGLINAPEDGRYGLVLRLTSAARGSICRYSLTVDGTEIISGRRYLSENPDGDKALDLAAGRHPAELRLGCSNGLPQIRVSLQVKLPSAEQVGRPSNDFIIHPTRAAGD